MRLKLTILSLLAALLISACGAVLGPTAQEMTLQAQNSELSTQMFDLRSTATVEVDRMLITVEHAQTEVAGVNLQRDAMRATQIARGTDSAFFDINIPDSGSGVLPEGITPEGLLPPGTGVDPAAAPPLTPDGLIQPNTDANAAPQPTAPPAPASGPRLENPSLTTNVGSDDCALDSTTTFPETTPEIYIVASAVEFPANTTVTTTWTREGEVIDSYDYTYDFAIDNACVWSFIDQTDYAFTPGNWTVQLTVSNGAGLGPIAFTVTGDAAAGGEEAMMEEGQ